MPELTLEIRLLEDLHSGDGDGHAGVDATISRRPDGTPELPWTHVRGVLRASADALVRRGQLDSATVDRMLGWNSYVDGGVPSKGQVMVGSPLAVQTVKTHTRTTTALVPMARVPMKDTRRTKEWLPAGTRLVWRCSVPEELLPAWQLVLRATRAFGSLRNRGAGRIDISMRDEHVPAAAHEATTNTPSHEVSAAKTILTRRLRLVLRAIEPLCFPVAGQVGNILETELHVPGSALRGGLLHRSLSGDWGADARDWANAEVVDEAVWVGNAYPAGKGGDWLHEHVVPAWSSLRQPKWRAKRADVPPWIPGGTEVHELDGGSRLTGTWFVGWRDNAAPVLRRTDTVHHQRIRVADRSDADQKQGLFSVTSLAAGTRWVADLLFQDLPSAERFADQVLAPMLQNGLIALGRGARPARIEEVQWLDDMSPDAGIDGDWSLLLTSDLLLRGSNLAWLTDLRSPEVLRSLLGELLHHRLESEGHLAPGRLLGGGGVQVVRGFNASTRMPRPAAWAMTKGSMLTFRGLSGELAQAVAQELAVRRVHGERRHEGFGRVLWRRDVPHQIEPAVRMPQHQGDEGAGSAARSRAANARVEQIARAWASADAPPLTRRQIGALLELARQETDVRYPVALRGRLQEFGQLRSSTPDAQAQLKQHLGSPGQPALSRSELELLCRWLLALTGEAS